MSFVRSPAARGRSTGQYVRFILLSARSFGRMISHIPIGVRAMKAFLLACVSAIVIAFLAVGALDTIQKPVDVAFVTSGVRL
jgi:hypothetical protein